MTQPMLVTPGTEPFDRAVLRKVNDPAWGLDTKMDGRRLLLDLDGPRGYNRSGGPAILPAALEELLGWAGRVDVRLDGELVGTTFHCFDIIGPSVPTAWEERRQTLDGFVKAWAPDPALIQVIPWAIDLEGKALLAQRVVADNLEGLVAKRLGSPYQAGRSTHWQKLKFVGSVDCIVTAVGIDGKRNLAVSVYDGAGLVQIAEVSALTGDGPTLAVGDVCEVTYLAVGANRRLIQPVRPIRRLDKAPDECTIAQLDHK